MDQKLVICDPSCFRCGYCHPRPDPSEKSWQISALFMAMSLLGWLVIGLAVWYFFFSDEDSCCSLTNLIDNLRYMSRRRIYEDQNCIKIRIPRSPFRMHPV
ncbi:hypothetical protein WA026_018396 [Henosepilachna vigintioctopunctata]|uniref:Uncharacterized protein n=2 Tax=Henosepilachna vigintioctopunctata TaxID=420089 RepID=A0AAW1V3Q6_9CUCU